MDMSVALQNIVTSPVVLAVIGYAVVAIALAYALQPMRIRMVELAESMLSQSRWNRAQRDELNMMLDSMDSALMGLAFPIAVILSIGCTMFGVEAPKNKAIEGLFKDRRFHELTWRYFVSLLGANPLAALITIPLMVVWFVVRLVLRGSGSTFRDAVEVPAVKVSEVALAFREHRLAA